MNRLILLCFLVVGCQGRVEVNSQDSGIKTAYDDGISAGKFFSKTGKKLDNPYLHSMEEYSRSKETKWNQGFNQGVIESETK